VVDVVRMRDQGFKRLDPDRHVERVHVTTSFSRG
jgi:hypothetical protein